MEITASSSIIKDNEKSSMETVITHADSEQWVTLNVGGSIFTTTLLTLTVTEPESILAKMFAEEGGAGRAAWNPRKDGNGAVLIDRSGMLFECLLNYLRTGKLILSQNILMESIFVEAEFYNFQRLLEELGPIAKKIQSTGRILDLSATNKSVTLTRPDVIRALMVTPSTQELRFQGIDFEGCDLSKLDLRCVNLKFANLKRTNLTHCNLSYANLDRADLTEAVLDHAVMFGVKMPCAVMERCSMQDVNMDDPAGSRANLEGVNLRNARLDNSQLSGANFRVANLKYASMTNCELKQVSFPGANLELCNMSGSNLFEANLRGANLANTNFGHLASALHMSQTI
ncbi:BTB/POZ domain-containing protein KCTD9 [Hypsibius exemplaris]|uniref:BTB/POZ domain-containing protein KCTD9 n=1 Tax=Hypsibius exemplaris TaxID=2072580 RepID=A0A1W0WF31_HYPEX|nr:BTB/POZ domain-containing protein KCTD9 [Hypsibius exemplaris]